MMTRLVLGAGLILGLSAAGCDGGDDPENVDSEQFRVLNLTLDGLEDLGAGHVYEGWLIVEGQPVSTGRFSVDPAGAVSETSFEIDPADADAAAKFVLTIEPADGDDPAPSAMKLLAGPVASGAAVLTLADPDALGTDLVEAKGEFLLQTPTSAEMSDYALGIWFLNPGTGAATLEVPALPAGWVYEGWIVGEDGPVSTGRFASAGEADSDGKGPTAGPLGAPPKPGQDFIDPASNLVGQTVVISVEPDPDNAPEPFLLKPLVAAAVEDVPPPGLQAMDNNAAMTNPSGSVRIE